MAEYDRFCPISLASSVLGDRWTPLVVRELLMGNTRFNEIARCLPGLSRSLLVQRLGHLERNGVIDRVPSTTGRGFEYHLTPAGEDLEDVLLACGRWAVEWLYEELRPHAVDPIMLMWWMHRRIDEDKIPSERVVVQFDHTAPERVTLWMVFEQGKPSVCVQHPGYDTDVLVTTPTPVLAEIFQGLSSWHEASADGRLEVMGPRHLLRALPHWFTWSSFAAETRARSRLVPTA